MGELIYVIEEHGSAMGEHRSMVDEHKSAMGKHRSVIDEHKYTINERRSGRGKPINDQVLASRLEKLETSFPHTAPVV